METIWQNQIAKIKDGMTRMIDDIMEFPFDWINEEVYQIAHLTLTVGHVHEALLSLNNFALRELWKRLLDRYDYQLTNDSFDVNFNNNSAKTSETNQEDESPLSSDFSYSESC